MFHKKTKYYFALAVILCSLAVQIFGIAGNGIVRADSPACDISTSLPDCTAVITVTENLTMFPNDGNGDVTTQSVTVSEIPQSDVLILEDVAGTTPVVLETITTSGVPTIPANSLVATYTGTFSSVGLTSKQSNDILHGNIGNGGDLAVYSELTGKTTHISTADYDGNVPATIPAATATINLRYVDDTNAPNLHDPGCYNISLNAAGVTSYPIAACASNGVDINGNPINPTTYCYVEEPGPQQVGSGTIYNQVSCTDPSVNYTSAQITQETPTEQAGQNAPTCENVGGVLSWAMCPIINGMVNGVSDIYTKLIVPELKITPIITTPSTAGCTPSATNQSCDPAHAYEIWSDFRLYGNVILVVALLFLVFAEILGGGIVEAYTLKKMLPRILIAAILINLSIYLVAALVDMSNVFGGGITYLINEPFKAAGADVITLSGLSDFLIGGGVIASIWAIGALSLTVIPFLLLFILLPAFIAIIGVVLTILLRQALIILLVLSAPIAFALYCLPNTEQYFKKWWNLLFKTLLIYPIVSIFFALSTALAVTMSSTGGTDPITQILAVIALFVPLFLIPFAFKIAGGVLGGVYGAVNGAGKKLNEAIKGDPNDPNALRNRSRRQILERATQIQGKFVEPGYKLGASKRQKAAGKVANLFGNYAARSAGYNEAAAKRREQITNFGNDDLVFAGGGYAIKAGGQRFGKSDDPTNPKNLNNTGKTQYYTSKGKEISKAAYTKGKSLYGGSQHDVTQSLGYATYKAQTDDDFEAMQFAFNRNAEAGGWDQSQITGNYLGATFPYKGRSVFHRYEVPQLGSDGRVTSPNVLAEESVDGAAPTTASRAAYAAGNEAYYGGLKQMHKSGESFKLSSVSDKDWAEMSTKQRQLERKLSAGTSTPEDDRNLAMTYELFDSASQKMRTAGYSEEVSDEAGGVQIVAGGASPASASIIEQAVKNRTHEVEVSDPVTFEKELVPRIDERTNGPRNSTIPDGSPKNRTTFTTGPTIK
jgi:hypothetical protein